MKLLNEIVWSFGMGCHQYANDTWLYISLSEFSDSTEPVVQWLKENKLSWIQEEVMPAGKVDVLEELYPFVFGGQAICRAG